MFPGLDESDEILVRDWIMDEVRIETDGELYIAVSSFGSVGKLWYDRPVFGDLIPLYLKGQGCSRIEAVVVAPFACPKMLVTSTIELVQSLFEGCLGFSKKIVSEVDTIFVHLSEEWEKFQRDSQPTCQNTNCLKIAAFPNFCESGAVGSLFVLSWYVANWKCWLYGASRMP